MSKIYAKVVNGKIVEFPVQDYHIVNRNESFELYTPLQESPAPEDKEFYVTVSEPFLLGGKLYLKYEQIPMPLEELLKMAHKEAYPDHPEDQPLPDVKVSQVRPELVEQVMESMRVRFQTRLDALAKERHYDDSASLLARYSNSTMERFKKDADHMQILVDHGWLRLIEFGENLMANDGVIPKSVVDVDNITPVLSWAGV